MKKLFASVLTAFLAFAFSVTSFASYNLMIDDSANLFSQEDVENINFTLYNFAADNDWSVAVVTTDDASGKSSREFADDYYDNLIFNSGWDENGMCFLIDMDNREIYVSCAGICIDEYTDYELDSIVDSGYSYAADGEYAECVVAMINEADNLAFDSDNGNFDYYDDGLLVPSDEIYYEDHYYDNNNIVYEDDGFDISHIFIYIVIGLAVGGISVFGVYSSYKNTGKGDEYDAADVILELTASNDNIISRNVITTKIPRNNNNHRPGGRGGGGGVSVHRSSGGVRHSGAGRKF